MSNEVTQWIAEIKALREQLAEAYRDRDAALDTAAHWSQLYNREAEQRRAEVKASHQIVDALKTEIQQLKADFIEKSGQPIDMSAISAEVEKLDTGEELKQKLIEVMLERDRLVQSLKAEQANHERTRQNLTIALGDTIDLLTKQRGGTPAAEVKIVPTPLTREAINPASPELAQLPQAPEKPAQLSDAKSPSLQLPPTRPAPPRL